MIRFRAMPEAVAALLLASAPSFAATAVSGSKTTTAVGELALRLATAILEKGHRSVAVFAFRGPGAAEANPLAASLAAALSRQKGLEVLDLTASGAPDPKSAAGVGREAGAEIAIVGTVALLPSKIALELQMFDSATGASFGEGEFFLERESSSVSGARGPDPRPEVPASGEAPAIPSFETESYRIRVVGAVKDVRSDRSRILVDLVVESLVRDAAGFLKKGPELRGAPPGVAGSWHLVDDAGHRFEQRGADSAGICSPAHDAGIDLLPSGRVSSRFTFVAPGRVDSSRLTLSGAELAPRPGRQIEIGGIKVSDER